MPRQPPSTCSTHRCGGVARRGGRCDACLTRRRKSDDARRGSAASRGYGHRWRRKRETHLVFHPLCVRCEARGLTTEATEVDHIVPHKGDERLFWDPANWQSLCHDCHSRKTAGEDGGFGREPGEDP